MKNGIGTCHIHDDSMFYKKNQCKILFYSKIIALYLISTMKTEKKDETKNIISINQYINQDSRVFYNCSCIINYLAVKIFC